MSPSLRQAAPWRPRVLRWGLFCLSSRITDTGDLTPPQDHLPLNRVRWYFSGVVYRATSRIVQRINVAIIAFKTDILRLRSSAVLLSIPPPDLGEATTSVSPYSCRSSAQRPAPFILRSSQSDSTASHRSLVYTLLVCRRSTLTLL